VKPLTDTQRSALEAAKRRKGGILVSDERPLPNGCVTRYMAAKLVDCGWATRVNDTLLITKAGRAELNRPRPERPSLYLARRGDYTTNPKCSIDYDEPPGSWGGPVAVPAVRAQDVNPDWRANAEAHRKSARADEAASRLSGLTHPEERLRELRRMAAERGIDASDELRFVNRGLKALERKVRGEAA
jgi:hypothetical protein